jgi:hypothetical protein
MHRPLGQPATPLALLLAVVLALTLGACSDTDDGGGGDGATTISFTSLDNVSWREDLGCGFGFGTVDTSEHFRLTVHHTGERTGRLPRSVELPDPAWEGEVVTGTNLAANWCSDVLLDPRAKVAKTWEVVEGTLTFDGDVPPLASAGRPLDVRARLTGVVAEDADGERTAMADVSLHNGLWGFFAG